MKPRTVCHLCRQRHRKCVVRPGNEKCNGCEEAGKDCHFGPKFQFRPGGKTRSKHGNRYGSSTDHQTSSISVGDRLGRCSEAGEATPLPSRLLSPAAGRSSEGFSQAGRIESASEQISLSFCQADHNPQSQSIALKEACGSLESTPPARTVASIPNLLERSTAIGHVLTTPRLTRREAYLLRLYTLELAPISDGCDDARHFAVVVPRLALEKPILLFGVFAFSSRYDGLCKNQPSDLESTYYHNRCIELLIAALSKMPETYDSVLLTAVVISRLYEEYDIDADTQHHHLSGTRDLLSHEVILRFASEGGLAEAASWIHLRQAIDVSLTRKQPVDIPLQTFESFTAFRNSDDTSYANRAVYLFAKAINILFARSLQNWTKSQIDDTWENLNRELAAWSGSKPSSFESIYDEDADWEHGKIFPTIWLISSPQLSPYNTTTVPRFSLISIHVAVRVLIRALR